jgi:CheY-like chemotaxis protein
MKNTGYNILLADDDDDDCNFFKDAIEELSIEASLNTVNNGVELMNFLNSHINDLPDIIFLDLNMPLKTGMECLSEIKQHAKLKQLPVIIYSTSANMEVMDVLYNKGADYYIRKPAVFHDIKATISRALTLIHQRNNQRPDRRKFFIQL